MDVYSDYDIHPIDIVETLAEQAEWDFARHSDDKIAYSVERTWDLYSVSSTLTPQGFLRTLCTFDFNPPMDRIGAIKTLIDRINSMLWGISFSRYPSQFDEEEKLVNGAISVRCALPVVEMPTEPMQVKKMIDYMLLCADQFYPAFQLVAFEEKAMDPDEAMKLAFPDGPVTLQ